MTKSPKTRVSTDDGKRSKTHDKLGTLAVAASTTIIALQSTAFANPAEIARPTQIINDAPLLGPEGMMILGATFATLGAYRLMKARKGTIGPEGESRSS